MSDQPVSEQSKKERSIEVSPRLVGWIVLIMGVGAAYVGVLEPLRGAAQHADLVSLSLKGTIVTPLLMANGVLYAFAPKWMEQFIGSPPKPSKKVGIFYAVLAALGFALYVAVRLKVRSYGYAV